MHNFLFAEVIADCTHSREESSLYASKCDLIKVFTDSATKDGFFKTKHLRSAETCFVPLSSLRLISCSLKDYSIKSDFSTVNQDATVSTTDIDQGKFVVPSISSTPELKMSRKASSLKDMDIMDAIPEPKMSPSGSISPSSIYAPSSNGSINSPRILTKKTSRFQSLQQAFGVSRLQSGFDATFRKASADEVSLSATQITESSSNRRQMSVTQVETKQVTMHIRLRVKMGERALNIKVPYFYDIDNHAVVAYHVTLAKIRRKIAERTSKIDSTKDISLYYRDEAQEFVCVEDDDQLRQMFIQILPQYSAEQDSQSNLPELPMLNLSAACT